MKKFLFFILAFLFAQAIVFSQNTNYKEQKMNVLIEKLETLKTRFAPDKRTAIFEYKVNNRGGDFNLNFKTNIPEAFEKVKNLVDSSKVIAGDFELLPSEKLGNKIFALANLSVINLRTKPKHSAEMASQALLGTPMKIYEKKDGWFRVQTPDNYIAWTDADAIKLLNKEEIKDWVKSPKIIFTATCGFVYENAELDAPKVSDLTAGDILVLTGKKGSFYSVKFPDGREGFVYKKDAEKWTEWLNSHILSAGNIISAAFRFMGVPYLWGGTSSKGLDCSGFTKTVFFLNGIILPRDASQQVLTGNPVPTDSGYKKFQPGDLLFFGKHATDSTKEKVTHVALYIGGGKFIHASGRVRVNSLEPTSPIFSEYRFRTFLHARRILSSINKNGIFKITKNKFYTGVFK
jgi:cell wall-associated NlpC family hydrolase